jgi:hypothetical protein
MAEKNLFFNAFPDATSQTGYDRNYNADDISDWFSIVCETGVVKTNVENNEPQGLKVVAAGGMAINVKVGKATIKGKGYINDSVKAFTCDAAGSSVRYDYIVLRYNNVQTTATTSRKITIEYVKGTGAAPTVANLTRTSDIYEVMLAYITIPANGTALGTIYDKRGDKELCPWFTAVKGYEDYYDAIVQPHEYNVTLSSANTTVITNLSSELYNNRYSLIEVYTNGLKEPQTAYTVSLNAGYIVITFTAQKSAGAKITVILNNFLDGEGMNTALAQYTQLLQDVTNLKAAGEYNYICNGINDNTLISNVVKAYLQGGTDYGSMKLNIIGTIGMQAPAQGSGSSTSPYSWFDFNIESNRRVILDFTRCGQITPPIRGGAYNQIFNTNYGIHVIGANIVANETTPSTNIRVIGNASGVIKFDECRFYITGYQDSLIATRGTFNNCRGSIANSINNSYCFLPTSYGVVKIYGGEYYAYTGDSSKQSAIVGQSGADAVTIMYGVSAPTAARGGFYQTNSILQWTGGGVLSCTDLISELPMVVVSGISNIRGTIAKSKTHVW